MQLTKVMYFRFRQLFGDIEQYYNHEDVKIRSSNF